MADGAKIKVGIVGAADAQKKLQSLKDSFRSFGSEVGNILAGTAREIGSVSVQLAKVDPSSAAQKFRDYRKTVTEFSISSRRSIGDLKAGFADLSNGVLLPDEEVADFSSTLAKSTYDFGNSGKALKALRGEGLETGRSLQEMGPIAETLRNRMGVSFDDMPGMFDRINASAEAMGTVGGPAALIDDINSLGGALNEVSIKGTKDASELVATLAAVGKGLRPEQQRSVQQQLISRFTQGGEQMRMNLGIQRKDFYDENGNIKVTSQNIERLRSFYLQRAGGNVEEAKRLASFRGNLGPQLAASLFRAGFIDDIRKAESAKTTNRAAADLDKLKQSQHGQELEKQIKRDREQRENLGEKTNAAQQKVADLMPQNSVGRFFALGIGGGIASSATSALMTKGLGKAAQSLAASLFQVSESGGKASVSLTGFGSKLGSFAGKAGLVAGVGVAAYEGASYLDKKLGISTKIANALDTKSAAKEEAGVDANRLSLLAKTMTKSNAVKKFEQQGFTHGQALYMADHPGEKTGFVPQQKQAPIEVRVSVQNDSGNPLHVVQTQKGKAGQQ